jgi:hypothetical protein
MSLETIWLQKHQNPDCLVRQARFNLWASPQDIDYQHTRNLKSAPVVQMTQNAEKRGRAVEQA